MMECLQKAVRTAFCMSEKPTEGELEGGACITCAVCTIGGVGGGTTMAAAGKTGGVIGGGTTLAVCSPCISCAVAHCLFATADGQSCENVAKATGKGFLVPLGVLCMCCISNMERLNNPCCEESDNGLMPITYTFKNTARPSISIDDSYHNGGMRNVTTQASAAASATA